MSIEFEAILEFCKLLPSDKHWGNRTTFHKTEDQNLKYDQGFNKFHSEVKKALEIMRKKYETQENKR